MNHDIVIYENRVTSRIVKPPVPIISVGDTVKVTNLDGTVDNYLIVSQPCNRCSLYGRSNCLRYYTPTKVSACLISKLPRSNGSQAYGAFMDLDKTLEEL